MSGSVAQASRLVIVSRAWWRVLLAGLVLALAAQTIRPLVGADGSWSAWERGWGVVTALVLVAGFVYSGRRRAVKWARGTIAPWLDLHLLIGALLPASLLLHTGFRFPTTGVGVLMWTLGLWMTISGVVGRLVQRWIPRLLTSGLRTEAVYERIPELVDALRGKAEELAADADDSVRRLVRRELAGLFDAPCFRWIYFVDITGGSRRYDRAFDHLAGTLRAPERETLRAIQTLVRTKHDLDAHYTLQRVLRWWVLGHAPVAIALTVLAAAHVVAILYY